MTTHTTRRLEVRRPAATNLLRPHRVVVVGGGFGGLQAVREEIASPRGSAATVATRLAINELRSARARRERYVGDWLPEPVR